MSDDFTPFGYLLIGPHPETGRPNCWLYWQTKPPTPLSPEENERAEKLAADIFNDWEWPPKQTAPDANTAGA